MTNPYQTSNIVLDRPVLFRGTRTRDDFLMALRDRAPQKGDFVRRLMFIIALTCCLGFAVFTSLDESGPMLILAGYLATPTWIRIVRYLSPAQRTYRRQVDVMAANSREVVGFFDEDGLASMDESSVSRCHWGFFQHAKVFPTHLVLTAFGGKHDVTFPWHFFQTVGDARCICDIVVDRVTVIAKQLPTDEQLATQINAQAKSPITLDPAIFNNWSDNHWPFDDAQGSQLDSDEFRAEINLTAATGNARVAILSVFAVPALFIWYLLPIWIAATYWLAVRVQEFTFSELLVARPFETILAVVPLLGFFGFFLVRSVQAFFGVREIAKQTLVCVLRPNGIHQSHPTLKSWFRWSQIKELIKEKKYAGWTFTETGTDIKYPPQCFTKEEAFEDFKQALSRFMDMNSR